MFLEFAENHPLLLFILSIPFAGLMGYVTTEISRNVEYFISKHKD